MRSLDVPLAVVLLYSVRLAAEASLLMGPVAALAIGGLSTLRGAAVIGERRRRYNYNRRRRFRHDHDPVHPHYRKRFVEEEEEEDHEDLEETENLLFATASQMDPMGCLLKLLCHLQTKEEAQRSFEENILAEMFSNNNEVLTSHSSSFVYASQVGMHSKKSAACDLAYPECPIDQQELESLLQKAWGCGPAFPFPDKQDEVQTEEVPGEIPEEDPEEGTEVPQVTE